MIITFIIIYFLQSNFFSWFTISKVMPNLFVMYILIIGLFAGRRIGIISGVIFGLILDFLSSDSIGQTAVLFGLVGLLGGKLEKNFSKDSKMTLILMTIVVTIAYETIKYFLIVAINEITAEILPFIKIILIECIYNSILLIIMCPIIKKAGYAIEKTFKTREMLTRYF